MTSTTPTDDGRFYVEDRSVSDDDYVFGCQAFDDERSARADFDRREQHAKDHGGNVRLYLGTMQIASAYHWCPND
jgi:hypothetical protein